MMYGYNYSKIVIKESLDLRDVFRFYGIAVAQNGFCSCPFHSERTPSCRVNKTRYYCFGCGESGDIFDFMEKFFALDFLSAIHKINDDFNLNLPLEERRVTAEQQRYALQVKTLNDINKRKLQELEDTYWLLYDKWVNYDRIKREKAPIHADDIIIMTNEYVEAVTMLPKIEYELDLIGGEINEFRHRANKKSQ